MVRRTKQAKERPTNWRDPNDFGTCIRARINPAFGSYQTSFNRPSTLMAPDSVGRFVEARCVSGKLREYIKAVYNLREFNVADARSVTNSPVERTVTPYFDGGVLPSQTHQLLTAQSLPFIVCDPSNSRHFAVFEVQGESFIPAIKTTYWRSGFNGGMSIRHLTMSEYERLHTSMHRSVAIPAFYMQREHFDSDGEYESYAHELLDFAKRYTQGVKRAIDATHYVDIVFANAQTTRSVFKMFAGFQALCRMFGIPDDIIAEADRPSAKHVDQLNITELRRHLPDWADSWLDHRELLSGMATVHRTMLANSVAGNYVTVAQIDSLLYVGD
jgi:hypothetical protein